MMMIPKLTPTQIFHAYFLYALLLLAASFVPFVQGVFLSMAWLLGLLQIQLVLKSVAFNTPPVAVLGKFLSPMNYLRVLAFLPIFVAFEEQTTLEVWQILLCHALLVSVPMWFFAQQISHLLKVDGTLFQQNITWRNQLIYVMLASVAVLLGIAVFGFAGLRFIRSLRLPMLGVMAFGGMVSWAGVLMWRQLLVFRQPEKR